MLRINQTQMQALAQQAHEHFITDMVTHLRTYFPTVAWLLTPDELRKQVIACIERASHYQLTSQQQVCRYLNLAANYGWNFDSDPDLLWMHKLLTDTSLTQPGERLDHLVQTCLHRQSIEEHNLALRQQLGLVPVKAVVKPEPAEDYLGPKRVSQQVEPTTEEGLFPFNPLGYHLSKSLWHSAESIANPNRKKSTEAAWVNNSYSLLRKKNGGHYVSSQN